MVGTSHVVGVYGRVTGTIEAAVRGSAAGPAEMVVAFRARQMNTVGLKKTCKQ